MRDEWEECWTCEGSGYLSDGEEVCHGCEGDGGYVLTPFPYDVIGGEQWSSVCDALKEGYEIDQIWSVVNDGGNVFTYGPPHHYVNVLHFVVTAERHDHETYFDDA